MKHYLELFLAVVFTALVLIVPILLAFAVVCEAVGWYDANGRYCGPFSKARRK